MVDTLITQDRIAELIRLCGLTPEGLAAEVGVFTGGSLIRMAQAYPEREFWGFDTFTGLPAEKHIADEIHKPNEFSETSFDYVFNRIKEERLKNVTLIPGLFPSSMPVQVHDSALRFSFVHVDTDFYLSVKDCIEYFYPVLKKGGIMVFDDFNWSNCPGVKRALDESGIKYQKTDALYQAYIIKE